MYAGSSWTVCKGEIAELIYFSPERVELLCASVCRKLNVTEVREMEILMKKLLS